MINLDKKVKIRYIGTLFWVSVLFIVVGVWWIDFMNSEKPRFSVESGFYKESFYLSMESEHGSTIYYTLDGSLPNENSMIYEGPILIENATQKDNSYSMREDGSAGFRTDLITIYETEDADPQYRTPDFLIDKCNVIRAISISKDGKESEVVNASYFVGIEAEDYGGCNIMSLITEPSNFFDQENGIYVTGNVFEKYLQNGEMDPQWRFWEANYRMQGKEWEREAFFQYFDQDGNLKISKNGGVRIHGGVSRGYLPKSLNLYAKKKYVGNNKIGTGMFKNEYNPQRVMLTNGGNLPIVQFSDYFVAEKTRDLAFANMFFEPVVLFINGEYWGAYWLNEKYDADYVEYYYGVEQENVVLIKAGEEESGNVDDIELFDSMKKFIIENDMSIVENYEAACELIDIESYIDYYAVMIYIARNTDWPKSNYSLWRSREIGNGEYADGKWRWMLYDCNSRGMGNREGYREHNTLEYVKEKDEVFNSLWQNEKFRMLFKDKILYIAENCFAVEDVEKFIVDYNQNNLPVLRKAWERFYGSNNNKIEEYSQVMAWQKEFFCGRQEVVESWFE